MNPIVKQILWIAVFFIGLGLQGMPELFRKNERAYKIMGDMSEELGNINLCGADYTGSF